VVGVGPGIGASVATKFAKEGFSVALIARTKEKLDPVATNIAKYNTKILSVTADATDPVQVKEAFDKIKKELGPVNVLVYNCSSALRCSILDIKPEQFELSFKTSCAGALYCSQQVLPSMITDKQGTIIFTGATGSLRGSANFASFASGKFALRALAQSMAREFGPQGVHVSHVIIDGAVESDYWKKKNSPQKPIDSYLSPDAIANNYWLLHTQDKTTWTQELDLRPYVEKF